MQNLEALAQVVDGDGLLAEAGHDADEGALEPVSQQHPVTDVAPEEV